MKINKFTIFISDRKLRASILLLISGLVFLGHYILKDKINSKSELIEINAKLNNFSFIEKRHLNHHIYTYYLYLDNYKNKFQIIADFADYFKKDYFERSIKIGDSIRIYVSRKDFSKINSQQKIKLFGIYKQNETYLDCDSTIYQYNGKLALYGGLIFLIASMIIIYYNRNNWKINAQTANSNT
jgi:hypothetical protein